jgi:hypothetical protein
MNQRLAEIAIAAFANPEQLCLTPCRMLARHQAQPGRKLTTIFKGTRIPPHRCDQRRGTQHSHAWDRQQTLALGVTRRHRPEFGVIVGELLFELDQLVKEPTEELLTQGGQLGLFILELAEQGVAEWGHPFGQHDAILAQQASHLVDQRRTLFHQPLANECGAEPGYLVGRPP